MINQQTTTYQKQTTILLIAMNTITLPPKGKTTSRVKLQFSANSYKRHEIFKGEAIAFVSFMQKSLCYPTHTYMVDDGCILSLSNPQEKDVKLNKGHN